MFRFAGAIAIVLAAMAQSASGQVTAPTTAVGSTSATQTAMISVSNAGTLNQINVLTQGATGLDFNFVNGGTCATGTFYLSGQTCTVQFSFTPTHPWIRTGGISLLDASNNLLGAVYLAGGGTGPQLAFYPDAQSPTGSAVSGSTGVGSLNSPTGIAVDGSGNAYVVLLGNNQVLRVPVSDPTCSVSTSCTTVGSGLNQPYNVAVDGLGNVYIADSGNNRILKVPPTDLTCATASDCTTVGSVGGRGIAVDGAGNVYIGTANSVVEESPAAGGGYTQNTIVPSSANITPVSLAVDSSGSVYIADQANNRVLKETAVGGGSYTQIVVASGSIVNQPQGLAIDGGGNVYVADTANNNVLIYTATGSSFTLSLTLVGALGTNFNQPSGIGVDRSGILYVVDTQNSRVVELNVAVPPVFSFAATYVGSTSSDSPQTVNVGNIGTSPAVFPIPSSGTNPAVPANFSLGTSSNCPQLTSSSSSPSSLVAGTLCAYNIFFVPTASGSAFGSLTATDNNLNVVGATQSISVSGTGIAVPQISLSPTSLTFGNQLISTSSATTTLTVTSTSTVQPTFSSISATGDFSETNNCTPAQFLSSNSCTVMVTFTPTAAGSRSGTLTFVDNAPTAGSQQQVALSGFGIGSPPPIALFSLGNSVGTFPQLMNLIQGSDGNFYGTSSQGGSGNNGTAFFITQAGAATVLHSFTGSTSDGAIPYGGLMEGVDGNFYGTTYNGGTSNLGTVYKVSASGVFTLLHSFAGNPNDGSGPVGSLVQGIDGNFYGATNGGGAAGLGTVFKMTPAGLVTILHAFAGGTSDGQNPSGGLVQGTDGNLYGMTNDGGSNNYGTIYKVSPTGAGYNLLHTFQGGPTDGDVFFNSSLVQYSDGNFYGVTYGGGATNQGTFFSVSPGGTFTLLNSLANPTDLPLANVTVGSDGNFYATTSSYPASGSIIQLSSSGTVTQLSDFTGADGSSPYGIVQGMDGNFYGMTNGGGSGSGGVVFELPASPALPAPVHLSISPTTPTVGQPFTMTYTVANAFSDTLQQCFATNTAGDLTGWIGVKTGSASGSTQTLTAPAAGTFSYTLTCGGVESNVQAITVAPGSPVFGTMTFSPTASAPFGTIQAITIGDTLTYSGPQPTGAVAYILNGVSYPATCTTTGSPTTCTAIVPASTISALPAGSYTGSGTFAGDSNYTAATAPSGTFTISQATPQVTWNSPAAVTYGTALSATQLNASTSVPGTFAYTPAVGTVLTAGTQTLSVTFTPTDTTDYATITQTVSLTVNKATPTVIWSTPSPITYGTSLGSAQLNATASIPGTFGYTPATGTVLTAGTQTLSVTFTPTDTTDYNTASQTVSLTVSKVTPTVTWNAPLPITYGTALSSTQLNAIASTPGTFVYTPALGTLLTAGSQILQVAFTPTDMTDFNTASGSITLTVNKATPTLTWNTPLAITYGTPLGATQLNATATSSGSTVPGTFAYTPAAGAILAVGSQTLSVTFTPSNPANFGSQTASVILVVMQAAPVVTVSSQAVSAGTWSTTVTATVSYQGTGAPPPTGAVSFTLAGGAALGNPSCSASTGSRVCSASFYTSTLAAGSYTINAVEAPDVNYASASATGTLAITTATSVNIYPTCTLGIIEGTSATQAATVINAACTDPKNLSLTSTIDWGDGTIQSASPVNTHTYPSLSSSTTYNIVLSATDSAGNSGSASETVVVVPTVSIAAGTSTTVATTLTGQSPAVPPTPVTFLCTSVSAVVNGVAVTNALPANYGIVCTSPPVSTSSLPLPVNITVTVASCNAANAPMKTFNNLPGTVFAITLPGIAFFTLAGLPYSRRKGRQRFAGLVTMLLLCLSLTACGGGFTPTTGIGCAPAANYYLTITAIVVNPPPPTGFVQTSLIVPLTVH